MSLTPQEQLELQNKVAIAEFGVQTIIDMCQSRIDHYVQTGKKGHAVVGILEHAETVLKAIKSKPGRGS